MGTSLPEVFLTQHAYIHTPPPHAESPTALKIASRVAKHQLAVGRCNSPVVLSAQHIAQRKDEDMERRSVTNIARLTVAAMVLLTGCATIRRLQARDTEELLTAAGFKKQLVDAADTKPLEAGPPYRLVSRTKDGTVQYTYADPDNCRCVYLGGSKEYAEYRRLRRLDDERRLAAEDVWGRNSWGLELP